MRSAEQVVIGIPVRAMPELLDRTLENLRRTAPMARVLLLPDRPDNAMAAHLARIREYIKLPASVSGGAASCFNRLIHSGDAEVYLLLENGTLPASRWLERLLSTFHRIPQCGLTGPSTNRSWNQQCVLSRDTDAGVGAEMLARSVERRFGAACRKLAPLHSLGDFCYAVRGEVVDAIGDADEGYTGPYWEMDYNIRAQRAGFLGVWTCGAYVHRSSAPAGDAAASAQELQKARELYQSKFCGLQLRGLKSDYRSDCRGDSCPNFAPRDLIQISVSRGAVMADSPVSYPLAAPLVTCIMPTYNRRKFVPRAMRCFLAQDYPNLELVIVDDGTDPIQDLLPNDARVRYFRMDKKEPVGAKRNFACSQARGEYIVHWDDDDWHAPTRVSRQITRMREMKADVCGSSILFYICDSTNIAYRYQYPGPTSMWMGPLSYPTRVWRSNPFEPIEIAEDVKFVARIPAQKRLDLKDPSLSIGVIHDANTSPKMTRGTCWVPADIESLIAIAGEGLWLKADTPEVSCIMPTRNRRRFVPLALACFRSQTCASKELIVVDDGDDSLEDLLHGIQNVVHVRLPERASIGAKRNIACERARGQFIAHWDDDDWHAPDRLQRQLEPLRAQTHDLTGLVCSFILEMPAGHFWSTTPELHRRMNVGDIHGGTLLFRRSIWQGGIHYPDVSLAEDAALIKRATSGRLRILRLENAGSFVYLRHAQNTWKFQSGSFLDPSGWRKTLPPAGFTPDLIASYRAASTGIECSLPMMAAVREVGVALGA